MTLVADFNPAVAVTFQRMRALLLEGGGGLQEGVLGAGDLKGSQRAAGANLSADVAVGAAWVMIDTGARNGVAHVYNDAVFNAGPFTAGHATLPRVDQVVLRYNDSAIPTGAGNTPTIEVLTGTATSGATLDNRLGATALPNDCVRLCDVLMPAVAASVTTANIRDRRPWARGAHRKILRNDGGAAYTTTSAAFADLDATNLRPRIECSGVTLRLMVALGAQHSVAGATYLIGLAMDGTMVDSATSASMWQVPGTPTATTIRWSVPWELTPAAGSHLFSPQFAVVTAGTLTVAHSVASPVLFTVEEVVRQDADNT
jgi:hypothetical protein